MEHLVYQIMSDNFWGVIIRKLQEEIFDMRMNQDAHEWFCKGDLNKAHDEEDSDIHRVKA